MKMRNKWIWVIIPLLAVSWLVGCKQRNRDLEQLQGFVEQINEHPGQTLDNGTVLQGCEYKEGDSLLTYRIKVDDDRFSKVSMDSVKHTLSQKLGSPDMQKLVGILSRNAIGIQYVFETEDSEMTIVFTPSELMENKKQ